MPNTFVLYWFKPYTYFCIHVFCLPLPQMAWLGFFPNSYAATGNQTHVGSVAALNSVRCTNRATSATAEVDRLLIVVICFSWNWESRSSRSKKTFKFPLPPSKTKLYRKLPNRKWAWLPSASFPPSRAQSPRPLPVSRVLQSTPLPTSGGTILDPVMILSRLFRQLLSNSSCKTSPLPVSHKRQGLLCHKLHFYAFIQRAPSDGVTGPRW